MLAFMLSLFILFLFNSERKTDGVLPSKQSDSKMIPASVEATKIPDPFFEKQLYVDRQSESSLARDALQRAGRNEEASLLAKIADQPQTIWLTGPTQDDPEATRDMNLIERTSTEANEQGAVPVYMLYAIPQRDACATYSTNTMPDNETYLRWLDSLLERLQSKAIFLIEADAVAHTLQGSCLNQQQVDDRYALLQRISTKLSNEENVLAAYLDAGHSEWFPDSSVLVEPLKRAGVNNVRGIVVNVSFFEPLETIQPWATALASKLGNDKTIIIDTSRNGNGLPPSDVTGEDRWCNPLGRGLGMAPSFESTDERIDAYLWVKRPGESDGSCRGNPPAGSFSESLALELTRNAQ